MVITVVAGMPQVLDATLTSRTKSDEKTLTVKRSHILDDLDPEMRPVWEVLHRHCHKESNWGRYPSNEFIGYEVELSEYQLYSTCPGGPGDHNCRMVRQEESVSGGA